MKPTRRGFSLIEVLVSLAITGMLLAATLAALDSSFKSYKATTEAASTNVVARIVMQRVMAMIRTGTQFGPYPDDPLDPNSNPVFANFVEFRQEGASGAYSIIRIERRDPTSAANGPYELWYVQTNYSSGGVQSAVESRPLLANVRDIVFTLEYDPGPRLRRATVDLSLDPNDFQDAKFGGAITAPTIRMVSTAIPRKLD